MLTIKALYTSLHSISVKLKSSQALIKPIKHRMIISDKKQFIFVHIPKTAGSSIQSALSEYQIEKPRSKASRLLRHFNLPNDYHQFRFTLHSTLTDAQRKMPSAVFQQFKKVAFVRNPWDRMVSSYAYKIHGTAEKKRSRDDDFETFLHAEFKRKKIQQCEYLQNVDGEIDCDFIGRFETLADDYQRLGEILDIKLPTLPTLNKSKSRSDYRNYYNDNTKSLIQKHYQNDIDIFGYHF